MPEEGMLFREGTLETWGPLKGEDLFGEHHSLQLLMNVEAALARVQARLGVIPNKAAEEISRKANPLYIDQQALCEERRKVVHPMVTFLNVWSRSLEGGASEYLHYGATTSDIWDTAYVLLLREASGILFKDLRDIEALMLNLAENYRDTPMVGRTLGQHALPMTFGFKVAAWAGENRRNIERLKDCLKRLNTGMISGAVGTYAGLGKQGFEIEALTMQELGLGSPDPADWHGARDKFAEFGNVLALIGMTFGKIGQELFLLQSTDIGEIEEGENDSKVGSSTMPHKKNPSRSRSLVMLSRKIRRHAEILLDGMMVIHERDQISANGELKEICLNTEKLLKTARHLFERLVVRDNVMRNNLNKTRGLILAEEVMFYLGRKIGKRTAHELVRRISKQAVREGLSLREALLQDPEASRHLLSQEDELTLQPEGYLGLSGQVVDRLRAEIQSLRQADPA